MGQGKTSDMGGVGADTLTAAFGRAGAAGRAGLSGIQLPDAPSAPTAPIPQYQQPAMDPLFQILLQNTQQDNIEALMRRARDDQGMILARYGTRLAQAGTGTGSPLLTG